MKGNKEMETPQVYYMAVVHKPKSGKPWTIEIREYINDYIICEIKGNNLLEMMNELKEKAEEYIYEWEKFIVQVQMMKKRIQRTGLDEHQGKGKGKK